MSHKQNIWNNIFGAGQISCFDDPSISGGDKIRHVHFRETCIVKGINCGSVGFFLLDWWCFIENNVTRCLIQNAIASCSQILYRLCPSWASQKTAMSTIGSLVSTLSCVLLVVWKLKTWCCLVMSCYVSSSFLHQHFCSAISVTLYHSVQCPSSSSSVAQFSWPWKSRKAKHRLDFEYAYSFILVDSFWTCYLYNMSLLYQQGFV